MVRTWVGTLRFVNEQQARRNDWNPIRATLEGQRSVSTATKAEYMTAPDQYAGTDQNSLQNGGRPYMTK